MTNTSILDIALDALDARDRDMNPDSPIAIRDMMIRASCYTMRADLFDDMTMIHLDLDDEMHELALIAIHDRDTNELRKLILHSDSDILDITPSI